MVHLALLVAALSITEIPRGPSFPPERERQVARGSSAAAEPRGFNLKTSLIPRGEIRSGGPPKDGIPALTRPAVVAAGTARYMKREDRVIGVSLNGKSRAYPLAILNYHENVNDELGGKPIAVTYCPLCDSAVVFDRLIGGRTRRFGISGLLYNSNVLLYDRQPHPQDESLWSQLQMRAVTGPAAEKRLTLTALPCDLTTWADWTRRHPETTVLSPNTGYARDYGGSPYKRYFAGERLMFPVRPRPDRRMKLKNKDRLVIVKVGDSMRAYPVRTVARLANAPGGFEDTLNDQHFRLIPVDDAETVRVEFTEPSAGDNAVLYAFWFAWHAMHPKTEIFRPPH